jgi:hypothetical protein
MILPSRYLPPLEFCFEISPIQAEKSRPDPNTFGTRTVMRRGTGFDANQDDGSFCKKASTYRHFD